MFDHLTNEDMLDRMYIDYRTFVNQSVWRNKHELWRKWLRAN